MSESETKQQAPAHESSLRELVGRALDWMADHVVLAPGSEERDARAELREMARSARAGGSK
jgi:hypothetical protein